MRKGLVWGTLLYTVGSLLLLFLSRLGIDAWWVALPSIIAPFLFAPVLLLIPLSLWVRPGTYFSRPYLVCVGVLVLVFVISFGVRFLPRSPVTGAANATELRIMSLNHLKTNTDEAAIKATILRQNADIVALQELSPGVATMIKAELSERYPHQVLRPSRADGENGVAVLSRLPLEPLSYREAYRGQRFGVEVAGKHFELINLHLNVPLGDGSLRQFGPELRDRQLGVLVTVAERIPSLVVVGDFNLSDNESGYRTLAGLMTDAYRRMRTGFGFTYPARTVYRGLPLPPLVRLDYVWLKGLDPLSAHRDCRSGSDHCAVIADVRLP